MTTIDWQGIWHLGTRYLQRKRVKTILLIAAFTLVWLLPSVVAVVISQAQDHLRSRAEQTPLLIGRSGSPLELAFNGLYFTKPKITPFPQAKVDQVTVDGIRTIPLYSRFSAGDHRIVGTTIDYFDFRRLSCSSGRLFLRMGECVIGSKVATTEGLSVGESIISSPGSMFDIAGVYPLKMKICGILDQIGSPDDQAIFVDLKTTWVIEGLGHGHESAAEIDKAGLLQGESDNNQIELNASVVHYNEITADNAKNFHFHGDEFEFPITASIALPATDKARAILKGKFQTRNDMQIITPHEEMDEVFDTVFRIQKVVTGILILIGLATLAMGCLVFVLSYRLRLAEFGHLSNMGADPRFMRWLIGFEALFVLIGSLLLATIILSLVHWLSPIVLREVLG